MVDYSKFKIHSDYPTDNIVYATEMDLTTTYGDGYYRNVDISHSLPFIPLPFGIFSTDGGTTWLPINYTSVHSAGTLTATASKFSVSLNDYNGNLPSVVKIRVFAFAPSTYTGDITPPTAFSKFLINSETTYDELLAKGTYTLINDPNYQTIYTHNLGYMPRVMIWIQSTDYQGTVFIKAQDPASFIGLSYYTSANIAKITTTTLEYLSYHPSTNVAEIVHYRIYGGRGV